MIPSIDINPSIPDSIFMNNHDPIAFKIKNVDLNKMSVKVMTSKGKVTTNTGDKQYVITPLRIGLDNIGIVVFDPKTLANSWTLKEIKVVANK